VEFIGLILVLTFLSAFFSGSETAIFSLNPGQKEKFRKRRKLNKKAYWINSWLRNPEKTMAGILLGNLAVNIAISEIGHRFLEKSIGQNIQNFSLYSMGIITVFLLIFGEIMPKILALKISEFWLQIFSPLLQGWFSSAQFLVQPIYRSTIWIVSRFQHFRKEVDEQDLLESIQYADTMGIIEKEEKKILMRSVIFHHDTVYNAMVPRSSVFMLPHDISPGKARRQFAERKHQIALLYHEKEGHIIGFLHVRNLLAVLHRKLKSLRSQTQEILFFPESLPLKSAMQEFIINKKEVAAVVDESGEFSGLITFKDILTRIVGGFDEDSESGILTIDKEIRRISIDSYVISGYLDLNTFNEFFHSTFEAKDAETLSGFILEKLDGFPQRSTRLELNGFHFFSMRVENFRIVSFRVRLPVLLSSRKPKHDMEDIPEDMRKKE